jgi:hypothetical protein
VDGQLWNVGAGMRRAAKVDRTQKEIVRALRKSGCEVLSLAAVGNGCPDVICYRADKLFMLELKDCLQPPSKQKLTPHQVSFHKRWPVSVVNDIESALKAVGVLK